MRKRVEEENQQYSPVWNWFRRLEDKVLKVEKEDYIITTKE